MDNIMTNLNKVSARLSEEAFLSNKGLSNEVGIHTSSVHIRLFGMATITM